MSNEFVKKLASLSAAEEFFAFFEVPYEQQIVNVNRLHILKRFHQYLRTNHMPVTLPDEEMFTLCKGHLERAYQDFVKSTPAQEKVFKVFQDVDGTQHFSMDKLRQTLPTHG